MDNAAMRWLGDGWTRLVRFAKGKPLGALGGVIVIALVLIALLAPVLATSDPIAQDADSILLSPGADHWLGTDNLGRDLWSRIAHGARVSLGVGFVSIALGSAIGGLAGLVGGYYGRLADAVLQQVSDALMSFPTLVLALGIVAILGASATNVVIAIALVQAPRVARVVRSQALAVKSTEYVAASRLLGAGSVHVMVRHVLPHCMAPFIVIITNALGIAIVLEASLSFLGLGVPAPEPSWGGMLAGPGRDYFNVAPWMAIWPGLAIALSVYGFNLLGDALRDVLDPRQRLL
ncbi:MAG: ABC transporter permease [Chloroflexi bacterium]|nr:ABC transporter permease [Chloroflexota bacterium]